jgi:hypothetical protein
VLGRIYYLTLVQKCTQVLCSLDRHNVSKDNLCVLLFRKSLNVTCVKHKPFWGISIGRKAHCEKHFQQIVLSSKVDTKIISNNKIQFLSILLFLYYYYYYYFYFYFSSRLEKNLRRGALRM